MNEYRPRLSVDLTEEQYKGLSRIPWGLQRALFSAIIDDLNDLMDKGLAEQLVSAIVAGLIKPRELIQTIGKVNNGGG